MLLCCYPLRVKARTLCADRRRRRTLKVGADDTNAASAAVEQEETKASNDPGGTPAVEMKAERNVSGGGVDGTDIANLAADAVVSEVF